MIDYETLRHFPIPSVTHHLTKRDAAFYALSIGLGQDPLDPRHLRFVDYTKALETLPSMATVLAHPGFWLADPATGVDATRVVLGEQRIDIRMPLPSEGDVIGRTRVTEVVDKGPGKNALLYSEKEIIEVRSGKTVAVTTATTVLRGQGGFGGPTAPEPTVHALPQRSPDVSIDAVTRPEQALYYRMNGDDNPLHADPEVAARAGFPRPILHGLCTFGIVCHALIHALAQCDPGALSQVAARFSQPVFPGETIRTEIWDDGSFRARALERDVIVVSNGKASITHERKS